MILKILLAQAFSTFAMTGIIWLVQSVHYPAFLWISFDKFGKYHRFHTHRITWVVAPLMGLELASALLILILAPDARFARLNFVTALLTWMATGFISVPIHNRLERNGVDGLGLTVGLVGLNEKLIRALIRTNWIRTLIWTARSLGIFYFLWMNLFRVPADCSKCQIFSPPSSVSIKLEPFSLQTPRAREGWQNHFLPPF